MLTYPQRNKFTLTSPTGPTITIDSEFDSGNIGLAALEEGPESTRILLKSMADTDYQGNLRAPRSWFHFRMRGAKESQKIDFVVKSVSILRSVANKNHVDYRPVYKIGDEGEWTRWNQPAAVTTQIIYSTGGEMRITDSQIDEERQVEVAFSFEPHFDNLNLPLYVAFCFPYSYNTLQMDLGRMEKRMVEGNGKGGSPSIYFRRELLVNSVEGRKVELLTISSKFRITKKEMPRLKNLFPDLEAERALAFENSKKIVFITSRVHPGETPASYGLQGVLELLLDPKNPIASLLRKLFVFKIVPMINPDGVARGHFRMDGHGVNLNRYYDNPDFHLHPPVYAIKELVNFYSSQNKLFFFCDFHGHGNTKNCFFYGNFLNFVMQVECKTFAMLLSFNSPIFNYEDCNFGKKQMGKKNTKKEVKSGKEGTSRVSTYKSCNLVHSYTLEFGYHGNQKNQGEDSDIPSYSILHYKNLGKQFLVTILDLFRQNKSIGISQSQYKSIEGVRKMIAEKNKKKYNRTERKLNIKVLNINELIESRYYKEIKDKLPLSKKTYSNGNLDSNKISRNRKRKLTLQNNKSKNFQIPSKNQFIQQKDLENTSIILDNASKKALFRKKSSTSTLRVKEQFNIFVEDSKLNHTISNPTQEINTFISSRGIRELKNQDRKTITLLNKDPTHFSHSHLSQLNKTGENSINLQKKKKNSKKKMLKMKSIHHTLKMANIPNPSRKEIFYQITQELPNIQKSLYMRSGKKYKKQQLQQYQQLLIGSKLNTKNPGRYIMDMPARSNSQQSKPNQSSTIRQITDRAILKNRLEHFTGQKMGKYHLQPSTGAGNKKSSRKSRAKSNNKKIKDPLTSSSHQSKLQSQQQQQLYNSTMLTKKRISKSKTCAPSLISNGFNVALNHYQPRVIKNNIWRDTSKMVRVNLKPVNFSQKRTSKGYQRLQNKQSLQENLLLFPKKRLILKQLIKGQD